MDSSQDSVRDLALRAKQASRVLASAPTNRKDAVLRHVATALRDGSIASVLAANARDLEQAQRHGLNAAMIDRLRLDESRLRGIAAGVEAVIALPDPVGQIEALRRLPNGLMVGKMRVPLGLIAMIYESRPNVTVDAAALCLKSGNAVLLRGGSEAFHSNGALAAVFAEALRAEGLPAASVTVMPNTDRGSVLQLLQLEDVVDLAIPRGGEALIRLVAEHARVPVIKHYRGVCHVYVDADADLTMASAIVVNSKTQRPGVCNALETLLVDGAIAAEFLPRVGEALQASGTQLRGDAAACRLLPQARPANTADWDTEYLDLILSVAVVDGLDAALLHVARYGTQHTEAIVTQSYAKAQRWLREVDASLVLVNASTRFNDGYELGLGAEIGISTSKLHAYGPMGLEELCTRKWLAYGEGQVRLP